MKHPGFMQITVNGIPHRLDVAGHDTLLGVLRDRLGFAGTHLSCGRGECGACTVLLASRPDDERRAVYSCLTLAAACDGASVTTIEGLGDGDLHPLQQAFIAHDAVQCGFCTPGQILAAVALLDREQDPDDATIRAAMSGNLCRCGTYPNILLAVRDVARQRTAADAP